MLADSKQNIRLKDLILIFLKIGAIGFGGGVAMLALIRKYLITEKRWITDDDLATAVALGQMIPGPFVPNYVEYIGFRLRGIKGMISSVIAFLIPGFLAMLLLSFFYFQAQSLLMVTNIFSWIQPVIIGILLWASLDMGRLYLKEVKTFLIALFALLVSLLKVMPIITILICGFIGIIFTKRSQVKVYSIIPIFLFFAVASPTFEKLATLVLIFLEIGTLIFGGGYAAIPFIAQEVVIRRPWLTNHELLTGVALSQITPGPVALLATFVGYKVSGILGAIFATIAIFLPSTIILLIILGTYHYFVKSNKNKAISDYAKGFISGVKPAIVGFLVSATIILATNQGVLFAQNSVLSFIRILLVGISFVLLLIYKVNPLWLILGGAGFGFILTKVIM